MSTDAAMEVDRPHLLFKRALQRATNRIEEAGKATDKQIATMRAVIHNPRAKRRDTGEEVNVLEMLRDECGKMAEVDETLPKVVRARAREVGFEWGGLLDWLKEHWLQILQIIMSFISILIMFL